MRKIFLQTDHEVRFFGHKLSTWPDYSDNTQAGLDDA